MLIRVFIEEDSNSEIVVWMRYVDNTFPLF